MAKEPLKRYHDCHRFCNLTIHTKINSKHSNLVNCEINEQPLISLLKVNGSLLFNCVVFYLSVSPNFLARCLQLYASCSCCGQVQYMIYLIYDILNKVPGASLLNHSFSLLMLVSSSSSQTPGCPATNGPASKVRKSFSALRQDF